MVFRMAYRDATNAALFEDTKGTIFKKEKLEPFGRDLKDNI